jgi:cell division protein FtsB
MTSEQRPLAPIVYQVFIVLLVLVAGILWVGYSDGNKTIDTQKVSIVALNTKLNVTTLENTGLKGQITTLTNDKVVLQKQITILTNQTTLLQSHVATLSANVTALNGKIVVFNTTLTRKNAEISNLTTTNTQLRSQATTSNAQIASLQSKISNQTAIINMGKSVVFANDKNATILPNQSAYLDYKTSFAGYLGITFTSTSNIYLEVGSTEATNTWYGIYPITGSTAVGSFKIPVMPGTTYIKIVNPSLTSNVQVFYYITYYY